MGYYTKFDLDLVENPTDKTVEDFKAEIGQHSIYQDVYYIFEEECKWYENTEEMCSFSKKYPQVVFKLIGEGEESGDLWCKYFKDGKYKYCPAEITYEKYDEKELK